MEENINYIVQVYTVGENVRVCVERSWRTRDTHTHREREECVLKRFVLCEVRQDMMGVCLYECMTDSACLYVCVCVHQYLPLLTVVCVYVCILCLLL